MANNQLELAAKVQNIELSYPEEAITTVDPHLRHLMKRMLDKDVNTRIDLVGQQPLCLSISPTSVY